MKTPRRTSWLIPRTHATYVGAMVSLFAQAQLFAQSDSSEVAASQDPHAIVFKADFEADNWWKEWGLSEPPRRAKIVDQDPKLNLEPRSGKALRVRVEAGGHYGLSLNCNFAKLLGIEPEEIYFRYYLRFASDWKPERGGKLPGISGTYGHAGWGGRKVDGSDGWSARGLFGGQSNGKTPVGFYCYHADMPGKYGDNWFWNRNGFSGLKNDRWYCIEQHVKLNSPKQNDGILRAWVDGELVFAKRDVRMRDVAALKIEKIWVNIYYGGTWEATQDYHLYIDDIAISRTRIGR